MRCRMNLGKGWEESTSAQYHHRMCRQSSPLSSGWFLCNEHKSRHAIIRRFIRLSRELTEKINQQQIALRVSYSSVSSSLNLSPTTARWESGILLHVRMFQQFIRRGWSDVRSRPMAYGLSFRCTPLNTFRGWKFSSRTLLIDFVAFRFDLCTRHTALMAPNHAFPKIKWEDLNYARCQADNSSSTQSCRRGPLKRHFGVNDGEEAARDR